MSERPLAGYEMSGDMEDLDRAISIAEAALETTEEDDPSRFDMLCGLGDMLWRQFKNTGKLEQLEKAITITRRALGLLPTIDQLDDNDREHDAEKLRSGLGVMLFSRYKRLGGAETLTEAISLAWPAVQATPAHRPEWPVRLSDLSDMLLRQYELNKNEDYLEEAIRAAREAVSATSMSDPYLPGRESNLGLALMTEYRLTGDERTLDEGISYAQKALESATREQPEYISLLNNLMIILSSCQVNTHHLPGIDKTITLAREAIKSSPHHFLNPTFLNTLGNFLWTRYERTGNIEDLDEAISNVRISITASPNNALDVAGRHSNLGTMLLKAYQRTAEKGYLDEAVFQARRAIEISPSGHHALPGRLSNFSNILSRQFEQTGELQCLEQAISYATEAVNTTLDAHPSLAERINARSNAFPAEERMHDTCGVQDYVSEEQTPPAKVTKYYPELANQLNNLGNLLVKKFMWFDSLEVLDDAIEKMRVALNLVPHRDAVFIRIQNNLGGMLLTRSDKTGDMEDLEKAIDTASEAVKSTHVEHPDSASRLSNLSSMLYRRYEKKKVIEGLDRSIGGESHQSYPDKHLEYAEKLASQSRMLPRRTEKTDSRDDLDRAISLGRDSVERSGENDLDLSSRRGRLGHMLWKKYEEAKQDRDLDEGIAETRRAVDGPARQLNPAANPYLINQLTNLSTMLLLRYNKTGDDRDLDEAISRTHTTIGAIKNDRPRHSALPGSSANSNLQDTMTKLRGLLQGVVSTDLAIQWSNLSDMLLQRYEKTDDPQALYEAIDHAREAVRATPNRDTDLAKRLRALERLLSRRYEFTQDDGDLHEVENLAVKLEGLDGDI
ncbi:hypothetical protein F5B17DRAFT_393192 [Nemania serpens]|nr:hypothetical protein F5B17DRAFT_393192 [Nemania serpens]